LEYRVHLVLRNGLCDPAIRHPWPGKKKKTEDKTPNSGQSRKTIQKIVTHLHWFLLIKIDQSLFCMTFENTLLRFLWTYSHFLGPINEIFPRE